MSAVAYRLRSALTARLAATVTLVLVVALVIGVVLACAAGAQRTATAPDRYTAAVGGDFDALITQQDGGLPQTSLVAGLPAVTSAESITFVFGGLVKSGTDTRLDSFIFGGSTAALPGRLVAGREPNPQVPGEFVATRTFMASSGASIGDAFHLVTLTQAQADANGFDSPAPGGPQLVAMLVGVIEPLSPLGDNSPTAVFSPALLDLPGIGVSATLMAVHLRRGVDSQTLRHQLDTLPAARSLAIGSGALIGSEVRSAVRTQAIGVALLAAVAAIAATIVLVQLLSRFARIGEAERDRLVQIGFTHRLVLFEACGRAAVPTLAGSALAVALAVLPSGIFPMGYAGRLEPSRGIDMNLSVLVPGAIVMAIVLIAVVCTVLAFDGRPTRVTRGPSRLESVAVLSPSPVLATGLRFAFGSAARRRLASPGLALTISASVAFVVAAAVFGVSMGRLLDQPFRYGITHDLALGDDGSQTLPDGLQQSVEANPDVSAIVVYAVDHGRNGQVDVPLLGMNVLRGDVAPRILAGQLPTANDEIALGRNTADDLGTSVGRSVELQGQSGTRLFRVTGLAVIPGFGVNEGIGIGGVLTMGGLQTLNPTARPTVIAVRLVDPGSGAQERLAAQLGLGGYEPFRPAVIVNVARVRNIPFVLAALLGVLCLLTVVNAVVGSVRSQIREFAILRALGADGRWVATVVAWQTTLLTVVPGVTGVLAGVVLGRELFTRFADGIGAVDDAAVPLAAAGLMILALIVIANLVVVLPGRAARRVAPALRLHAE